MWGCTLCSEEPNAAKLTTQLFTVQSDDDPKQTSEATQEILNAMAMSVNSALPSRAAFQLLKTKPKSQRPTNKQQIIAAAFQGRRHSS